MPSAPKPSPAPLSVAPMMERTDRHFRVLLRQFSQRTLLYTEMVHTGAILHGDRARHLGYSQVERPLALQLGGDDPTDLAECARIAEDLGFDEVNLNAGCPSPKVQKGRFGASLMLDPPRVVAAVKAMRAATSLPVTVKHRVGVDDVDRYADMLSFVDQVADAGCDRFTVHARKAWLKGLSPKENRTIPPLRYHDVYRLKRDRPGLFIEINGGVRDLDQAAAHLEEVDAVMIGRAAYDHPALFAAADQRFFGGEASSVTSEDAVRAMLPYVEAWIAGGGRLQHISRHFMGLFVGRAGARRWRRTLGEAAVAGLGAEAVRGALDTFLDVLPE